MHPREFKRQRTGTGRVTHVSLPNSEILMGVDFSDHVRLNQIIADVNCAPVLLFPGRQATNISAANWTARQTVVIILDATWPCARKMFNLSKNLQRLPQITFDYSGESTFAIKKQPKLHALSTIEATYRILDIFDTMGLENLENKHEALLQTLAAIVDFQLKCEADPNLPSHRKNSLKFAG